MSLLRRCSAPLLAGFMLLAPACGYHRAGTVSRLPANLKVIAVPSFQNQTRTYHIETTLTAAVIREFNTRTRYQITNNTKDADAVLQGTVLSADYAPVTYDSNTGRASSALVTVSMKVALTDRSGKVLFSNPNYVFREQYEISDELSSFFAEESPALDRVSRDFARTLVSNVVEAF